MGAYLQFDSNCEWCTTCGLGTMNKQAAVADLILPNYPAFVSQTWAAKSFQSPLPLLKSNYACVGLCLFLLSLSQDLNYPKVRVYCGAWMSIECSQQLNFVFL